MSRQISLLFVSLQLFAVTCLDAQWVKLPKAPPGQTAFAVMGTNLFVATGSGLFRSSDNGANWTTVFTGGNTYTVSSLAVMEATIFAISGSAIYVSTNGGTGWGQTSGILYAGALSLGAVGSTLFTSTPYGVFVSGDNAASWTAANNGLGPTQVNSFAAIPHPGGAGFDVFAGTDGYGVFRTTDNGVTWSQANSGLRSTVVNSLVTISSTLYAGTYGGGVYRSTDSGANWNAINLGLASMYVYRLVVSDSNLFAGTRQGGVCIFQSNIGYWKTVNTGITGYDVPNLAVCGGYLFAGVSPDILRRPLQEMVTAVQGTSSELPSVCVLDQNYPNPFNPSTTIRYQLPFSEHVSLKVYNVSGDQVAVLVDSRESSGIHEIRWTPNLPSGTYYCRLAVSSGVQTRKLILLK